MPEFVSSTPFVIVAAIFAIILVIGIAKRAVKLLIWVSIIFVVLVYIGVVNHSAVLDWFENVFKLMK